MRKNSKTNTVPSVNNVFHLERFTTLKMTLWSLQVFSTVKWNHNLEKKVVLFKKEQSDCHDLYDVLGFIGYSRCIHVAVGRVPKFICTNLYCPVQGSTRMGAFLELVPGMLPIFKESRSSDSK